jgi:hypothetical protein
LSADKSSSLLDANVPAVFKRMKRILMVEDDFIFSLPSGILPQNLQLLPYYDLFNSDYIRPAGNVNF